MDHVIRGVDIGCDNSSITQTICTALCPKTPPILFFFMPD